MVCSTKREAYFLQFFGFSGKSLFNLPPWGTGQNIHRWYFQLDIGLLLFQTNFLYCVAIARVIIETIIVKFITPPKSITLRQAKKGVGTSVGVQNVLSLGQFFPFLNLGSMD